MSSFATGQVLVIERAGHRNSRTALNLLHFGKGVLNAGNSLHLLYTLTSYLQKSFCHLRELAVATLYGRHDACGRPRVARALHIPVLKTGSPRTACMRLGQASRPARQPQGPLDDPYDADWQWACQ